MLKTRTWGALILLALILSAAAAWVLAAQRSTGTTANIYLDGVCVESIDLSAVAEPYSFSVDGPCGSNRITVEPGRICVSEADCPDHICIHQGWISDGVAPIVCLPNKLVIRIEAGTDNTGGIDSVTK